jgi:hypothetical protein
MRNRTVTSQICSDPTVSTRHDPGPPAQADAPAALHRAPNRIDTPEVFGGVECGGRRASAHLKRLATGRRVLLRTDPSQDTFDRHDRLPAYARLRRGPDLALSQLRTGWASVYVYGGEPFARVRRSGARSARPGGPRGECGAVAAETFTGHAESPGHTPTQQVRFSRRRVASRSVV